MSPDRHPVVIVCGVSGVGKSTIGRALAHLWSMPFLDADDYHPQSNIDKMRAGRPLSDEDRQLWLFRLAGLIQIAQSSDGAVLACSALKEQHRELLSGQRVQDLQWVMLHGKRQLIDSRLRVRGAREPEHFFPRSLLGSQFDALEPPAYGLHVDVRGTVESIVTEIMARLAEGPLGAIHGSTSTRSLGILR